jgi:hypothetical protein
VDTQEERGHKINREEEKDDDDTFRYTVPSQTSSEFQEIISFNTFDRSPERETYTTMKYNHFLFFFQIIIISIYLPG